MIRMNVTSVWTSSGRALPTHRGKKGEDPNEGAYFVSVDYR